MEKYLMYILSLLSGTHALLQLVNYNKIWIANLFNSCNGRVIEYESSYFYTI